MKAPVTGSIVSRSGSDLSLKVISFRVGWGQGIAGGGWCEFG